MTASEIKLKKDGYLFSAKNYPARSHYKFLMDLGRVFPSTLAQVKYFTSKGIVLDVLNADDVEVVEKMLVDNGYVGRYRYTKSKAWVRLENSQDLIDALKKQYLS